ncbi:restriction endonuclease subunit S [Gordonia paraffinivorans]|uniref:restriction endonuclease subunit S n=1 Tax=Gordonia paraffinivorans TaxID=175628 RepID=UPI0014486D6D|nr:restriction endonuclease subunit S [Gordonia paraffinivorans]
MISEEEHRKIYRRCDARFGDLLLTKDGANTGNAAINTFSDEISLLSSVALIRPNPRKSSAQYILQYILSNPGQKQIADAMAGNAITRLTLAKIKALRVPIPAISEQSAIGDALRDADDLIATLERLIAKKQAIKQGMMQQLLTGRTRLPGYTLEWAPVRLRDAGGTYGGLVGKSKDDFGTGSATFVTFMEVMEGARLRGRRLARVRVRPTERQNRVLRGDVLFNGSSETPEEVALAAVVDYEPTPTTYLNSFCFGYRLKDQNQIDPTYLAHFFRSSQGREIVSVLAQGATRYNIAKTKLMSVSPMLPPIDEQRAIVSVLSDVEAEIEGLNVRLDKARAIKTGMMQQLLTGRTRLPVEAKS